MKRRKFFKTLGLTLAGTAFPSCVVGNGGKAAKDATSSTVFYDGTRQRPNIIFVHTDSWDGRVLGCLGHQAMKNATPNIDRLAQRGTVFRNTYCSHPICCPSRANMWSGRYTHHCESWNNFKGLEKGANTFKNYLEKAGYFFTTPEGGYGKHDYLSGRHSVLNRVAAWTGMADIQLPVFRMEAPVILEDENIHIPARESDCRDVKKAIDFLKNEANGNQPFFLYLGIRAPHPPFKTYKKFLDVVESEAVTIPPEDKQIHPVMKYQRINKNWMHGFSEEMVRKTRAIYYAMCAETDAMIGEIINQLDHLDFAKNTYIIFSSDHGENNMEHRQYYKMNMYESSVRVPLVIAGPHVQKGKIFDNIVSLIDLFPTLMDMAGVEHPPGLDGESLWPLLNGSNAASRNCALSIFTGCSSNTTMFMYRKDDWKYIAYPGYRAQLFNLRNDPDEVDNLAKRKPDIVKMMDNELRDLIDYEKVHEKVLAYNKASFRKWREEVKNNPIPIHRFGLDTEAATYEEIMTNIYPGWNSEQEEKLNRWLEEN